MAASHTVVGGLGLIASIAIVISIRVVGETLDADAGDAPYSGLWVYTPYVGPGERIAAKVFLQGGDGVRVRAASAAIDGAAVTIEDRRDKVRRPSKRFDMGKIEVELRAVVPADLAPGEHQLALDLDTTCGGSSYSKACGAVHLAALIRVGGAFAFKLLAAARAIGAALVVFFGLRRGWDPLKRWVSAGEKSGGAVAPAFIVLICVWAWCGYSLFARPLGAALASSSDVLYGVAIVAWLAVWPVAVRTRHRGLRGEPRTPSTQAIVRFVPVEDFEPVTAAPGGYRAAPARKPSTPRKVSLDAIAVALYRKHRARYRRSGNRLLPRWIHGPPVVFEAAAGEDAGLGFRMVGELGYILIFATVIAARFGRMQITIDGKSVLVDPSDRAAMVKARLDAA